MFRLKLDDSISSSEDLRSLIEELKQYLAAFHHAQIKTAVTKRRSGKDLTELSPPAAELLSQVRGGKPLTVALIEQALSQMEQANQRAPKIRLVLAAAPPTSLKRQLTGWVRQNVSSEALIDFRYDGAILGGMVVVAGSRIFDWSFRRTLLESRAQLAEEISHVR